MSKQKRRWGYVTKWSKTGKPEEIELYDYEKLELAKYNNEQCKRYKNEHNG